MDWQPIAHRDPYLAQDERHMNKYRWLLALYLTFMSGVLLGIVARGVMFTICVGTVSIGTAAIIISWKWREMLEIRKARESNT